jgi:hypothetical protein
VLCLWCFFCANVRFCSSFVYGLVVGTNVFAGFFFYCVVFVATSCRKYWLRIGVGGIVVG